KRLSYSKKIHKVLVIPICLFLIFLGFAMFGFTYSQSSVYGLQKILFLGSLTLWSFLGPFFLLDNRESLYKFFKSFLIIVSITTFYVIIDYFANSATQEIGRVGVDGANSIGLARSVGLGVLIIVCIYILKDKASKFQSLLNITLISSFTLVLFLTSARMALISLVVCLIIVF